MPWNAGDIVRGVPEVGSAILKSFGLDSGDQPTAKVKKSVKDLPGDGTSTESTPKPAETTKKESLSGSSALNTRQSLPPGQTRATHKIGPSEEELRLFGDYRIQSDAIRISIPQAPLPNMSKVSTGSFRPLDTLNQDLTKGVSKSFRMRASPVRNMPFPTALSTRAFVTQPELTYSFGPERNQGFRRFDASIEQEGPRKRQKVDGSASRDLSPSHSISVFSTESEQLAPYRRVKRVAPSAFVRPQSAPSHSQTDSYRGRTSRTKPKNEYYSVEKLVRPKSGRKKLSESNGHDISIDELSKDSVRNTIVDLSRNDDVFPKHRGDRYGIAGVVMRNADPDHQATHSLQQRRAQRREVPGQNNDHVRSSQGQNRGERTRSSSKPRPQETIHNHGTPMRNGRLEIQPNCAQRAFKPKDVEVEDNSIDELASATTLRSDDQARTCIYNDEPVDKGPTEARFTRNQYPASYPNNSESDRECVSSDIPPSRFISSKKSSDLSRATLNGKAECRISLKPYVLSAFRVGTTVVRKCTLGYSVQLHCFVVQAQPNHVVTDDKGVPMSIQPQLVTAGLYTPGMTCVHLICKGSVGSWHWTDIIFEKHEAVVHFLRNLQEKASGAVRLRDLPVEDAQDVREAFDSNAISQLELAQIIWFLDEAEKEERAKLKEDEIRAKRSRQEEPVPQHQSDHFNMAPMNSAGLCAYGDAIIYEDTISTHVGHEDMNRWPTRSVRTYNTGRSHVRPKSPTPVSDFEIPEDQKFSKKHGLGTPWTKPVVFPLDGTKKSQVSVEFDDLERLDEGEFLNDNLIQFCLRHSEVYMPQHSDADVYFFNSYFYTSLTAQVKGKRGINYDSVKRWTTKIGRKDIFNYDYVVIPINENAHWYLAIICNLKNINEACQRGENDAMPSRQASEDPPPNVSEEHRRSSPNPDNADKNEAISGADALPERYSRMSIDGDQQDELANTISRTERRIHSIEDAKAQAASHRTLPDSEILKQTGEGATPAHQTERNTEERYEKYKGSRRKSKGGALRTYVPDRPMIVILDSLGGSHPSTVRNLKDYLVAEAREKRGMEIPEGTFKGITAKGIPEQKNYCDCGLFLLGYTKIFVKNPRDFVSKVARRDFNEETDWPGLNPSDMRNKIRILLQELHAEQSGEQPLQVTAAAGDARMESPPAPAAPANPSTNAFQHPVEKTVPAGSEHVQASRCRISNHVSVSEKKLGDAGEKNAALTTVGTAAQHMTEEGLPDCNDARSRDDDIKITGAQPAARQDEKTKKKKEQTYTSIEDGYARFDKERSATQHPPPSPGNTQVKRKQKLFGQEHPTATKPNQLQSMKPPPSTQEASPSSKHEPPHQTGKTVLSDRGPLPLLTEVKRVDTILRPTLTCPPSKRQGVSVVVNTNNPNRSAEATSNSGRPETQRKVHSARKSPLQTDDRHERAVIPGPAIYVNESDIDEGTKFQILDTPLWGTNRGRETSPRPLSRGKR